MQIESEVVQPYTAVMQPTNWNDLRFLLAVSRGQTLANAARQLRVDDTTVSRRLAALQTALGTRLIQRQADNRLTLTPAGELVTQRAETMEQQFDLLSELGGLDRNPCVGRVRITSVPILINRLFAGCVDALLQAHPGLIIELIPDSRDLSLTHREADLAIRLARPVAGGTSVKARRIGTLDYAAYAATAVELRAVRRLPWITFDEAMSHLPQARWIARVAKSVAGGISGLRVHDAETALEAAAAGLGKTLLPTAIAERDTRLRRLELDASQPYPSRDIWLLAHADQMELGRMSAAIEWVEKTVAGSDRK
jgi:DNA-binding transcriptional LysR family regulator